MAGDLLELEIIDQNEDGVGVGKFDGLVLFTPGLVAGDQAIVKIKSHSKKFAECELEKLLVPSPNRIDPICPFSVECGGCTLCHISYEEENRVKKKTVMSALRRAGLDYSQVCDTLYSPYRTAYRNKITVHYDIITKKFGLYKGKSVDVLPFYFCKLCPREFSDVILYINENQSIISELIPSELSVRSADDGINMTLHVDQSNNHITQIFRDDLLSRFPYLKSIQIISRDNENNTKDYYFEQIGPLKLRFTTEAFRQVNHYAFEILLTKIHQLVENLTFEFCADLYCGSGIIGLSLAKAFPESIFDGIEINPDAVEDARYNANQNGLKNIRFFCGDASSFREKSDYLPNLVVVDPPRAGLSKQMRDELYKLTPGNIIYVSCNPQTLARDLSEIVKNGYEIKDIVPVNMFPMTRHVECVVLLSKT